MQSSVFILFTSHFHFSAFPLTKVPCSAWISPLIPLAQYCSSPTFSSAGQLSSFLATILNYLTGKGIFSRASSVFVCFLYWSTYSIFYLELLGFIFQSVRSRLKLLTGTSPLVLTPNWSKLCYLSFSSLKCFLWRRLIWSQRIRVSALSHSLRTPASGAPRRSILVSLVARPLPLPSRVIVDCPLWPRGSTGTSAFMGTWIPEVRKKSARTISWKAKRSAVTSPAAEAEAIFDVYLDI